MIERYPRKEMGKICFDRSATEIYNQIRGLNPWPVAYMQTNKGTLKVYTAEVLDNSVGKEPGTVLESKKEFIIQTGKGHTEKNHPEIDAGVHQRLLLQAHQAEYHLPNNQRNPCLFSVSVRLHPDAFY